MFENFRKIYEFAGTKRGTLAKSIVFSFINSVFDMLQIVAIAAVLKAIISGMNAKVMWVSLGIMLLSIVGKIVTGYIQDLSKTDAGYFMCAEKCVHIGDRLKYMPMGYFNSHSLGALTAAVTTTMADIESNASAVFNKVLHGYIFTLVMLIGISFFDWRIGSILLAGILIFIVFSSLLQKKSRVDSPRRQAAQAKLVEETLEYIQGMSVVKSFNLDNAGDKKIDRAVEDSSNSNLALEKSFVKYLAPQQFALSFVSVIVIFVSILFYLSGSMLLPNCLLMIISAFLIYSQLESAGSTAALQRLVDSSIDSIHEIDSTPVMDINGKDLKPAHFDIEMKDVGFSYDKRKILDQINLKIPEKTTTAVVGPSGSGKSTLCSLISRFWDVDEGSVTIGGRDVREYTLDSLLKNISVVFQKVYLFDDTITNNIKFGKPDATMEEVMEAAKKACCHDFISNLPQGYNTVVGEGGAALSGGERQRISIARAILKDAPIIILDEATSNVDPENESLLQSAIEALTRNKTIIMIAHRLKAIRNADQILVVDGGGIVQRGTHEELMRQPGLYAGFIGIRKKAIGWKLA
jgi:ATP-binding cassette, subfamily B, bacterial IrtB/YbtQ